jgi:hypothetical protein
MSDQHARPAATERSVYLVLALPVFDGVAGFYARRQAILRVIETLPPQGEAEKFPASRRDAFAVKFLCGLNHIRGW